ncbi:MAG TPA: D-2-hydroxyacid dehydrogenase family protein [Burkholderiales bacterium]|nr:D-2-hydroxyacid dehydrogenase family protein [Burkholderiales bacterium]
MKIAILNDYLRLSQTSADWSKLAAACEITVFDRAIAPEQAARALAPFDVICTLRERMPISRALIAQLPNLKMIAITGLYNRTLDVTAASERGIVVSYTELRGSYRKATCELTWGLILSVARHIPFEASKMRQGGWQNTAGFTLFGRTLGLLGLGRQGRYMVPVAKAFGMDVIAWSQNLTAEFAAQHGVRRVDKAALFATSDVLSVHLVLGERTRGLLGARELALMKPSAILVNAARGPIIDENALIAALRERRIAGAGLDVFTHEPLADDSPLRALPNVVLTPHQGHNVQEFFAVAYNDVVENITAFLNGKPIRVLTPERNASNVQAL